MGIESEWTKEVTADDDLLALEPDPKSRRGALRLIGHSPSAGRVIVVIATSTVTCMASTPGPPMAPTSRPAGKETMMAKTIDPALAEKLRHESEQKRRHSTLGYRTPAAVLAEHLSAATAA